LIFSIFGQELEMIFHALGAYIILLDYDFEFPQPGINTDTP